MKRWNDRGQTLVFVALAIFAILALAAIGIDAGFMYSVRHELQRSADAGALAGASAFAVADWNEPSVKVEAELRAREFAGKDYVVQDTLDRTQGGNLPCGGHDGREIKVDFCQGDHTTPWPDHIEVVTSRTVNLFFARILGRDNQVITARAVAWAAPTDCSGCVKPWAIPLPWVDDNAANGLFDAAEGDSVKRLCPEGQDSDNCVRSGTQMTLKVGSPSMSADGTVGQQTAGQFFIIQGNTSDPYNGAADYRDYVAGANCLDVNLNEPVDLMPGEKMGPTVKPVEDLINTGPAWNDTSSPPPSGDNNLRLVYVVVYDPRVSIEGGGHTGGSGTQAYIPGNTETKTNVWFAGFYLDDIERRGSDGWVTGKYAGIMLKGTGGCGSPGLAKHVRLVE